MFIDKLNVITHEECGTQASIHENDHENGYNVLTQSWKSRQHLRWIFVCFIDVYGKTKNKNIARHKNGDGNRFITPMNLKLAMLCDT